MEKAIIHVYRIAHNSYYSGFLGTYELGIDGLISTSTNDSKFMSLWGFKGYHYFLVTKGYWVVEIHFFHCLQIEKICH